MRRDTADDGSECQSLRSCLPSDQAVVIQKGFVGGNFFFLRIKIETEVATNEQQVFRINFLYILEMFASVFNSQEAIVFLQSLARKFLGSFLRTGNDARISFTPLPRKPYPLHVLVEYENV